MGPSPRHDDSLLLAHDSIFLPSVMSKVSVPWTSEWMAGPPPSAPDYGKGVRKQPRGKGVTRAPLSSPFDSLQDDKAIHQPQAVVNVQTGAFPGGPVFENPLSNAGDLGSTPGLGTKIPPSAEQLNSRAVTRGAHTPQQRPSTAGRTKPKLALICRWEEPLATKDGHSRRPFSGRTQLTPPHHPPPRLSRLPTTSPPHHSWARLSKLSAGGKAPQLLQSHTVPHFLPPAFRSQACMHTCTRAHTHTHVQPCLPPCLKEKQLKGNLP